MHVTGWLAKLTKSRNSKKRTGVKWGATYQSIALRTLVAAFNGGLGGGIISGHCLHNSQAAMIRGLKRSRGQEAYIPPATWRQLIDRVAASNRGFAAILKFLHGTGCRPGEAYNVEARHCCRADMCVVYPGQPGPNLYAWKHARRMGKERVIFLNEELAVTVATEQLRPVIG